MWKRGPICGRWWSCRRPATTSRRATGFEATGCKDRRSRSRRHTASCWRRAATVASCVTSVPTSWRSGVRGSFPGLPSSPRVDWISRSSPSGTATFPAFSLPFPSGRTPSGGPCGTWDGDTHGRSTSRWPCPSSAHASWPTISVPRASTGWRTFHSAWISITFIRRAAPAVRWCALGSVCRTAPSRVSSAGSHRKRKSISPSARGPRCTGAREQCSR